MLLRQLNQKKKKSLITQFSAATVAGHLDFWERFEKDHARMERLRRRRRLPSFVPEMPGNYTGLLS
jgi:hypothetical protein